MGGKRKGTESGTQRSRQETKSRRWRIRIRRKRKRNRSRKRGRRSRKKRSRRRKKGAAPSSCASPRIPRPIPEQKKSALGQSPAKTPFSGPAAIHLA